MYGDDLMLPGVAGYVGNLCIAPWREMTIIPFYQYGRDDSYVLMELSRVDMYVIGKMHRTVLYVKCL